MYWFRFLLIYLNFKLQFSVCERVCVCVNMHMQSCTHATTANVVVRSSLQKSVLFFHSVGPRDLTQAGNKCLSLLGHLTDPSTHC